MGKKTLVFGASLHGYRYSNLALRRLAEKGIETVGFGLEAGKVAGVDIRTDLETIGDIDTISLYMNPGLQREFYKDILRIRPRRVIFNPGTENPELSALLTQEGIAVEVGCTLVMLGTGQYAS
jgi:predicted CoA-binding protein